jgi:hypothetical protein
MNQARCSLSFPAKPNLRLSRIAVVRQNSFQGYDAAPVACPVNDANAATPDFLKNLIIAYPPLRIPYIEFAKRVSKRLFSMMGRNSGAEALSQKTAQTKTAPNTRHRSALRTNGGFLLQTNRNRNAAHRILETKKDRKWRVSGSAESLSMGADAFLYAYSGIGEAEFPKKTRPVSQ